MAVSELVSQTWTLTKKDLLLVARRRWFSTFIRAIAFPIVLSVVVASVKNWTHNKGGYGIGTPSPIRTLPEAFDAVGSRRPKFVLVDRGLPGQDVRFVIDQLTSMARNGGRNVQILTSSEDMSTACPSSSKGVTSCFGAVDIWSSPDQAPGAIWNYTIWQDSVITGADVRTNANPIQLYTMPLQRQIDSLISQRNNGTKLPDTILQYPYTSQTQAEVNFSDSKFFGLLVTQALGFVFFLALVGIAYHLTGHVVRQREEGMLHLIDAQMPNTSRWESLAARTFATHLAFDIVYLPAWIVCGAIVGTIVFPHSNPGWTVLLYLMAGLAMTSFSILASALFRHQQLSAISATVAAIAFAIVAQFSQSGQHSTNTAAATATGLLFPPSSFVYWLVSAAIAEIFSQPFDINQKSPEMLAALLSVRSWNLTPAYFLGFFVFQIVLYPILAILIERFMWGSSFRGRLLRTANEMDGNALRVRNFSKRYNKAFKKRDRTLAVDQLSLDVFAGTIMVLLGANGSGKSTTLSCIAGLESITKGTIEIDGSGGVGLCPQKNVMWRDMTVEEHVWFFQRLKNPSLSRQQSKEEVSRLIDGCDLKHKTFARSKTLSGGQQRKLQLSMMLAGGSRVCCIDEASSGIDPLARRKIWNILLKERGHRTLLLTTHFLDESEVLADDIALLSKGKLRAEGTVAHLKSSLGQGFRVLLPLTAMSSLPPDVTSLAQQVNNTTVLDTPDSEALTQVLSSLEGQGITDYKIEGPSIEKIFLRLADEMQSTQPDGIPLKEIGDQIFGPHETMALHTGKGAGPFLQTRVLFLKRLTILKHNFMPYVAALFVPLVVAGLVTRFLLNVSDVGLQCSNPNSQSQLAVENVPENLSPSQVAQNLILGPQSAVTVDKLQSLLPNGTFCYPSYAYYSASSTTTSGQPYCLPNDESNYTAQAWATAQYATSLQEFNSKINASVSGSNTVGSGEGGLFIPSSEAPVFAFLADQAGPYPAFDLLGTLDMALTNTSVAVSYENFAQGYAPQDFFQSLVAVFTTLGFVLFPGLFALYPTRERLQKVRAMHYSNGISSGPLWTAYALFDFMFLLLIAVLVTVIWLTNGYNWYGLGYMFVVFLFYGMAATAYSYVISLFAPSQLAAIAMTCIIQAVIAMLFFVGCFLTVDMADLTRIYSQLEYIYFTIALICPAVSLLRALLVALNVYGLSCSGAYYATNAGAISLYGGPILYLVLQFFVLVLFLVFWESGRSLEVFGVRFRRSKRVYARDVEKDRNTSTDATEDVERLVSTNEGLRVVNVSKTFARNTAVDNVSFGVLPSEKFALLGPNGAGKSTMISLIRGDLRADSPHKCEIHITGDSLMHSPVAAKQHLGVCPQFDAVDSMTLSEHLHFYARARGLKGKEKDDNIREIINRLGLQGHAKKLVKKLSGGTKRKLSLGIALIANPSVLLLDEPSSGMDAAAKRALWDTLRSISSGRSLLITTHSMEEADALCDRAGIMSGQMLALGTIDELHWRYSDRMYVQIVHEDAPRSSQEEMDRLWEWVRSTFQVAETEKSVGGQMRFAVPIHSNGADLLDGSSVGELFRAVERSKHEMKIRDYSIGQATLDQVFLNVVSRHGVDEENAGTAQRGGGLLQRLRTGLRM